MKKCFLTATVFLTVFLITEGCSFSEVGEDTKKEERIINTSGEAKIQIKPDMVQVSIGVETQRETVDLAREENASRINQITNWQLANLVSTTNKT